MSSVILAVWATSRVVWFRLSCVVPLVSKNFGARLICPVTVAPASIAAVLIPLTTEDWAPGSVTISSRWPVSRSRSTAGSTAWAYSSSSLACCWAVSRWLVTWSSSFCSFAVVWSRKLYAGPCSSVEPRTIPIASARNTATMETR